MKKLLSRKAVCLGLALCIITSMLAFACAEPEPEAPTTETPTTETPTTEKPTTETPTTETPTTEKPTTETPTTLTPQYGGDLKILAIYPYIDNMGAPQAVTPPGYNPWVPTPAIEGIIRKGDDGSAVPYLVSSWEWSDDYLSLILHLEEGVKFHDGTNFNAESVKWGLDLYKTLRGGMYYKGLTSIDVIDDYTLQMNMSEYNCLLLSDLIMSEGASISPTAFETNGEDWARTHACGTGPFKQVNFEHRVAVKFEKFDDYWQEGKPYLDSIEYLFQTDPMTAKASFLAGEGDVFAAIDAMDASEFNKTGEYKIVSCPQTPLSIVTDSGNPDSPFSDVRVRQAMAYAIDNKTIADAIGYGIMESTNQMAFPGHPMYNPNIVGYPFDPGKAKDLLIEAGYTNGIDTELHFQYGVGWETTALAIQEYLSNVGIRATLDSAQTAKWNEYRAVHFDGLAFFNPYMAIGYHPIKTLSLYLSQNGERYLDVFHPDEIDALLDKALGTYDQAEINKIVQEINRLVIDEYCTVNPIYTAVNLGVMYPYVHDAKIFDPWQEKWTPENAWLSK